MSASIDFNISFQECCPSDDQKQLAFQMQTKVADLFNWLLAGTVALDDYNAKVKAAKDSIETVVLICQAKKALEQQPKTPAAIQTMNDLDRDLNNAWDTVRRTVNAL